mmetsp:Transcript_40520/g.160775  ORF Transcript_40520/g.160775 Transcript_40520/m.160775 type:complete len:516 (-) Transcript_40520:440-1987(-)|eukprot:CAMPEP_0113953954 /NCGR_PEP_ID=MMETSP0011_2-20120614/151_1 /TAXON_ID=101924 /ORGANISM="Rhodosorus marinus" /LENGTH=515 /DNA_ID=CAMNT_0000962763 /DNA_START=181 /DNA_END=1728 /DNA_ORIENTATION=- /assembly_acc=CAM_ASM_000156
MSVEEAEQLLRSRDDKKVVAGLVIAVEILERDPSSSVVERVLDALPRGLGDELARNTSLRYLSLSVAAALAKFDSPYIDSALLVANTADISKDDHEALVVLFVRLGKRVRKSQLSQLLNSKVVELWTAFSDSEKPKTDDCVLLATLLSENLDCLEAANRSEFISGLQKILENSSKHGTSDEAMKRLLRVGVACVDTPASSSFGQALVKVMTKNPGPAARRGAFELLEAALTAGNIGCSDLDDLKAIELALRLVEVELRVRMKDFLKYEETKPEGELTLENLSLSDERVSENLQMCMNCFEVMESIVDTYRELEGNIGESSTELSETERAQAGVMRVLVDTIRVLVEFVDAVHDSLQQGQNSTVRNQLALAAGRVLSAFLVLELPAVEESARCMGQLSEIVDLEDLEILTPGFLVVSKSYANQATLRNQEVHVRMAQLCALVAKGSRSSERDLLTGLMTLETIQRLIASRSPGGPSLDLNELKKVYQPLRAALKFQPHPELASYLEDLLVVHELDG